MRTAYIVAIGVVALFGPVQPNSALAADVTVRAQNSSAFTKSAPSRNKARPTNSRFSPPQRLAPPQNEPGQARQLQPEASTSAPQTSPNVIASEPPYQEAPHLNRDQLNRSNHYAVPSDDAGTDAPEFASAERLLDWVSNYRDRPQFWKVPAAVHAMRNHRLFADEEQRWFCIGFIAGVLGTNPNDGPGLIPKMFPMPPKEQEVIIRAIAYSGRPDWQDLMEKNAHRMPLRKPLIDDLLNGRRATLQAMELETGGTTAVYALWGYYVASGQHEPVMRIMQALEWSKGAEKAGFFEKLTSGWGKDANDVEKVKTGGTAK